MLESFVAKSWFVVFRPSVRSQELNFTESIKTHRLESFAFKLCGQRGNRTQAHQFCTIFKPKSNQNEIVSCIIWFDFGLTFGWLDLDCLVSSLAVRKCNLNDFKSYNRISAVTLRRSPVTTTVTEGFPLRCRYEAVLATVSTLTSRYSNGFNGRCEHLVTIMGNTECRRHGY